MNFQDTFIYANFGSSSPNTQSSTDARRNSERAFPQYQAGHSATQDQSTRQTYMPHQTNRDVGQIVRKWHIKFSGSAKEQSVELFLTWRSWQDFVAAITHMYGGDRGHQQRILAEINARTQGRDELTRDYVVNLQALILKLVPIPSIPQQLDMLHRNMRPELQKLIRCNQVTDYDGLLDQAREVELALAADKVYHSPPPPASTYLPEFAYVLPEPPADQKKKQTPGVAPMGHQQPEPRESLEAMFRRVMAECLSTLTKQGSDGNSRQKASPPPSRKPKKRGNWENR